MQLLHMSHRHEKKVYGIKENKNSDTLQTVDAVVLWIFCFLFLFITKYIFSHRLGDDWGSFMLDENFRIDFWGEHFFVHLLFSHAYRQHIMNQYERSSLYDGPLVFCFIYAIIFHFRFYYYSIFYISTDF